MVILNKGVSKLNIIIAILPSLLFGISPIIATKVGGKAINQLIGTSYGQLIIGSSVYMFVDPKISINDFLWCFIGGLCWSIAQLTQFMSFEKMNVSRAMPISTGLQLIEIPLIGVIFWGDWSNFNGKILGFISILILIIGIILTSYKDKNNDDLNTNMNYKKGLFLLISGSFGFTIANIAPKISNTSGMSGILPLTLGMVFGGLLLGTVFQIKNKEKIIISKKTFLGTLVGISAGLGSLFYLISLKLNGVATAFPLTQMNVVVSTILGVTLLKEYKNKKESVLASLGLILIVISAFIISNI